MKEKKMWRRDKRWMKERGKYLVKRWMTFKLRLASGFE